MIHLHLNEIIKIQEDNLKVTQEWYEHAPKTLDELADVFDIMAHLIPYEPGGGIEWLPILKALKEINFDRVALFEPSGILPDKQADGLKRIKAGFERMAQEFAAA